MAKLYSIHEIELDKYSDSSISDNKIDNKITNLLNIIKNMSFGIGFFIFKASLAFIQLRKIFIKALTLYFFDIKHYI